MLPTKSLIIDPNREMAEIAQQILVDEAAAHGNSDIHSPPACRVLEDLRNSLSKLVGMEGFRVLMARALILTRARMPSLAAVTVEPDGYLTGLSGLNPAELNVVGAELIAQLLGLLTVFVGKGLTMSIVLGVWPDLVVGGRGREKGEYGSRE